MFLQLLQDLKTNNCLTNNQSIFLLSSWIFLSVDSTSIRVKTKEIPHYPNRNQSKKLSATGHTISEQRWKGAFNFTETVNNHEYVRNNTSNFEIYFPLFPLLCHIKFLKYFHGMALCNVWSNYSKNWVSDFLAMLPNYLWWF